MTKVGFNEALESICEADSRYDREAYIFLRDALDFTIKQLRKGKNGPERHVTPAELLDGIRQFAIKEFGPMVPTVFEYWGVTRSGDFGHLVFNLVKAGVFGKTENDSVEQFEAGYDFEEAFVYPFLPACKLAALKSQSKSAQHAAVGKPSSDEA